MVPSDLAPFKGCRLRTEYKQRGKGGRNGGNCQSDGHCSLRTNGTLGGRGGTGGDTESQRPRSRYPGGGETSGGIREGPVCCSAPFVRSA